MSCDCKVKPQYRGKSISFVGGGLTLVFPLDGSNFYNEKTCKKYPKYFECVSNSEPARSEPRETIDGIGGSRLQGNEVDQMGRRQRSGIVSAEDSGSISEQQNVESSPVTKGKSSSKRLTNSKRKSAKKD